MKVQQFLRATFEGVQPSADVVSLVVVKDGSEEVLCSTCAKPILGISLKHTGKNFYCHLSCCGMDPKMESLLLHFNSGHDDLIFTGELKNKGKENTVCLGCEKPVLGPGYECPTRECKFLLHQSCAQLPVEIQHTFHPDHKLSLWPPERTCCEACGKDCKGCFSYKCHECEINLDITCARRGTNNRDDCTHVFRPFAQEIKFTCNACGEEGKDLAAVCNICQLLIHGKCARFSRTIKTTAHRHSLAITYSLREVREVKKGVNIFCNLCYGKINIKHGAYFCKKCDYVAHGKCAYEFFESICEESDDLGSDEEEEFDEGLIEGAENIQHFSHHHILNISNVELTDNKLCDACLELISAPFYSCLVCNFFLHNRCVHLPRKKKHLLHKHKLTLISQYDDGELLDCVACRRPSGGFSYHCTQCRFNLDLKCFSMPETLEHTGHPHSLFLAINSEKKCKACDRDHEDKKGVYVCTKCELAFCFECATLPFEARHRSHKHSLKFAFVKEINFEDYYCLICEKKRNLKDWIYYCPECDFPAHTNCVVGRWPYIKFGKIFKIKYHEHPLALVKRDEFSTCDVCRKEFLAFDADSGVAFECAQCKLCVDHPDCLPKAKRRTNLLRRG